MFLGFFTETCIGARLNDGLARTSSSHGQRESLSLVPDLKSARSQD